MSKHTHTDVRSIDRCAHTELSPAAYVRTQNTHTHTHTHTHAFSVPLSLFHTHTHTHMFTRTQLSSLMPCVPPYVAERVYVCGCACVCVTHSEAPSGVTWSATRPLSPVVSTLMSLTEGEDTTTEYHRGRDANRDSSPQLSPACVFTHTHTQTHTHIHAYPRAWDADHRDCESTRTPLDHKHRCG